MDFNERRIILENTRNELKNYFNETNIKLNDSQINQLSSMSFNYFVEDKEMKEEPGIVINRLTYTGSGGVGGGKTIKPRNILLNWDKLIETGLGVISGGLPLPSWTLFITGLLLIKSVTDMITVNIDERTSMTLWAMRSKLGRNNYKKIDVLLLLINDEITQNNRPALNLTEFDILLTNLKRLGCVKCNENNEWCFAEQIKIN